MKRISVTMKLFFWEKFHCDFAAVKKGRLKSRNFDFGVVNFDTMKLIFYAIVLETLMPQGFLDREKERKLQYHWYHNFRSYLVGVKRLELPASSASPPLAVPKIVFRSFRRWRFWPLRHLILP